MKLVDARNITHFKYPIYDVILNGEKTFGDVIKKIPWLADKGSVFVNMFRSKCAHIIIINYAYGDILTQRGFIDAFKDAEVLDIQAYDKLGIIDYSITLKANK